MNANEPGRPIALRAQGVRKSYRGHEVLQGVDLTVREGQVCTLLGPSGAGKSTFLRCVNLLENIDGGELDVYGVPRGYAIRNGRRYEVSDRERTDRRAGIGMVFQHFNLFPHMTVLQNITVGPTKVKNEPRAEAEERARRLLARVGLADKAHEYPGRLSGGQQQRVGIARAVAMRPRLLLLDEITSALDPELVREVLDVVADLAADGMTMLIVTHEMAFARKVSDVVAFMEKGKVMEFGSPEQVLDSDARQSRASAFCASSEDGNV
ncbi:amino acid ABC transporter ATP-binding protein [Streptomyces sp. SID8352]|uniref:amino acid ABC transporter ATP-binding protein n=1 Tax=Streptomyces sp. SID8352 TaxID=2690338 RepID=UPI001371645B|nr:amino acid ABC transporter ATP-binding protein [Streptomyces sp. SID8352]MYU22590.1 ATP-binding cassette domain-containing protein [Streptomyces sp. SID8352]